MPKTGFVIGRLTILFGGALLILMMLQIGADVVLRALGTRPVTGTVEIVTNYYMVGVSFLPVAFAELHRRHIEATVFTDMLPVWSQSALKYVAAAFSLLVYGVLTWQTAIEAMKQTARGAFVESGDDLIVIWPAYWILPVSFVVMCTVLLMRVFSRDFESTLGDVPVDDDLAEGESE